MTAKYFSRIISDNSVSDIQIETIICEREEIILIPNQQERKENGCLLGCCAV
jgi:hypothetical protein